MGGMSLIELPRSKAVNSMLTFALNSLFDHLQTTQSYSGFFALGLGLAFDDLTPPSLACLKNYWVESQENHNRDRCA